MSSRDLSLSAHLHPEAMVAPVVVADQAIQAEADTANSALLLRDQVAMVLLKEAAMAVAREVMPELPSWTAFVSLRLKDMDSSSALPSKDVLLARLRAMVALARSRADSVALVPDLTMLAQDFLVFARDSKAIKEADMAASAARLLRDAPLLNASQDMALQRNVRLLNARVLLFLRDMASHLLQ